MPEVRSPSAVWINLFDFVSPAPGGPVVRQLIIGAADVRIGADGEFQEDYGVVFMPGLGQRVRPLLQGAGQQGIVLVVFGQGRDVGGTVFQLQVRVAPAGEVDDFPGGEGFHDLDALQHLAVVVQQVGGEALQRNPDIGKMVQRLAPHGVRLRLPGPEVLLGALAFSGLLLDIIRNQQGKGNKTCQKTDIHI